MESVSPSWVTVVSGLPRSGTSMMMQMLEAGGLPPLSDHARAPDPDNPRGYYEFEAVKHTKRDPSWLPAAAGKAVKMVHILLYDLPDAYEYRVLMMQRNMDEVLASQQAMLQRLGRPGAAIQPPQLAAIYTQQLRRLDAWLAAKPNFAVHQVDYNSVLREPRVQTERINSFLGGRLDTLRMAQAVDPSLYRNRR